MHVHVGAKWPFAAPPPPSLSRTHTRGTRSYVALCYCKLDYYDVSMEILQVGPQWRAHVVCGRPASRSIAIGDAATVAVSSYGLLVQFHQ